LSNKKQKFSQGGSKMKYTILTIIAFLGLVSTVYCSDDFESDVMPCINCSAVVVLEKEFVEKLSDLVSIISSMPLHVIVVTMPVSEPEPEPESKLYSNFVLAEVEIGIFPEYAKQNDLNSFDVAQTLKRLLMSKVEHWGVRSIFAKYSFLSIEEKLLKNVGTIGHDGESEGYSDGNLSRYQ